MCSDPFRIHFILFCVILVLVDSCFFVVLILGVISVAASPVFLFPSSVNYLKGDCVPLHHHHHRRPLYFGRVKDCVGVFIFIYGALRSARRTVHMVNFKSMDIVLGKGW